MTLFDITLPNLTLLMMYVICVRNIVTTFSNLATALSTYKKAKCIYSTAKSAHSLQSLMLLWFGNGQFCLNPLPL